jgi:hypothetical protein
MSKCNCWRHLHGVVDFPGLYKYISNNIYIVLNGPNNRLKLTAHLANFVSARSLA